MLWLKDTLQHKGKLCTRNLKALLKPFRGRYDTLLEYQFCAAITRGLKSRWSCSAWWAWPSRSSKSRCSVIWDNWLTGYQQTLEHLLSRQQSTLMGLRYPVTGRDANLNRCLFAIASPNFAERINVDSLVSAPLPLKQSFVVPIKMTCRGVLPQSHANIAHRCDETVASKWSMCLLRDGLLTAMLFILAESDWRLIRQCWFKVEFVYVGIQLHFVPKLKDIVFRTSSAHAHWWQDALLIATPTSRRSKYSHTVEKPNAPKGAWKLPRYCAPSNALGYWF